MATLEDKILGEKLHNYCSSSEESDGENSDSDSDTKKSKQIEEEAPPTLPEPNKWEGTSTNTGPKGVIKDWQRFKQLETEKRKDDEKERIALSKKLTLTVQSALDEERENAAAQDDPDLVEFLNDDFLLNYQKQRMQEMLQQLHNLKFGKVHYLTNREQYLDAIDKEHKAVKVIIHIYEDNVPACRFMNAAFNHLSKIHENVKFCAIAGSVAGMSRDFVNKGVPAILIYKGGQVIGNYVRLTDDLGHDFDTEDVQNYLVEHGMLEDKTCTPMLIKNGDNDSDDSD